MSALAYAIEPDLTVAEFLDILGRSTLLERRPSDPATLAAMLLHASLIVTARAGDGRLVGVSRSLTDFAYCCYLSDLCVDAAVQRQGIGRALIERTRAALRPGCMLLLLAAPAANDYYPHIGFEKRERAWWIPSQT